MKMENIKIMAILNATPDSFFAPSRYYISELASAAKNPGGCLDILNSSADILDSSADILDIGACSTRPGSSPVGVREEWRRLAPVLEAVRKCRIPEISIDTYWSEVIERACDYLGRPVIANDVSAGAADPLMLPTVARLGLKYVAMCRDNAPMEFFRRFSTAAEIVGIKDWILDPGFGFGKTMEENWSSLHSLDSLKCFGRPILVGVSRKSMIYKKIGSNQCSPETLEETLAAQCEAVRLGAAIIRTHDVEATRRSLSRIRP